jgi:hypothetical protein
MNPEENRQFKHLWPVLCDNNFQKNSSLTRQGFLKVACRFHALPSIRFGQIEKTIKQPTFNRNLKLIGNQPCDLVSYIAFISVLLEVDCGL